MPEIAEIKEIKNPGKRFHPQYSEKSKIWNFLLSSYRGGMGMQNRAGMGTEGIDKIKPSGYYPGLFLWPAENKKKYLARVAMTPYTPYARRIVNTFVNYVMREQPKRTGDQKYKDIYADVNRRGMDITTFVRNALTIQRVLGELNILVDMPAIDKPSLSQYDEIYQGIRPYAVPLMPQNIVDWNIGAHGKYEWILIETAWTENNITQEKPYTHVRRTYYDSEIWQVYDKGINNSWSFNRAGFHPCNETPVTRITSDDYDFNPETPESWFYDLADMNREIYNLDSIDIVNFHNQTYGQLILPAEAIPDETQGKRASASEAWTENPDEKGISRYIQTTGAEHDKIKDKVQDRREEMFRLAGLYHRVSTRQVETAEAKKWDHEEMNQFLSAFAQTAENIETEIVRLSGRWRGEQNASVEVSYPKNYAVEDLESMIAAVLDLKTIGYASETGRKEVMKRLYSEIIGEYVDEETLRKIQEEVDSSEEQMIAAFDMTRNEGGEPTGE